MIHYLIGTTRFHQEKCKIIYCSPLIDGTDRIILLDDTMDLLDADGYFSVEVEVKEKKALNT